MPTRGRDPGHCVSRLALNIWPAGMDSYVDAVSQRLLFGIPRSLLLISFCSVSLSHWAATLAFESLAVALEIPRILGTQSGRQADKNAMGFAAMACRMR